VTTYPFDPALILDDGGTTALASGYGLKVGATAIYDFGTSGVEWVGYLVATVSALDHASGNETYVMGIELSNSATFASGVVSTATLPLTAVTVGDPPALLFSNKVGATVYRYARMRKTLGGTTPALTLTAFLAKQSSVEGLSLAELVAQFGAYLDEWFAGGGASLSADSITSLPTATLANGEPLVPAVMSADGVLRKLYVMRRTSDLASRTVVMATDMLQAMAVDGTAFKIPASAFFVGVTGKINAKAPPYNCKGDVQRVRDGVSTNGSTILRSATNPWTAQDKNKLIYIGNKNAGRATAQRTIANVNSAGEIVLSSSMPYSATGLDIEWGTDDNAGIRAALLDIAAQTPGGYGGVLELPPGRYFVDDLQQPARSCIYGYGGGASVFVRKPSAANTPTLTNTDQSDDFPMLLNIGIDGNKNLQSGSQRGYYFPAEPGGYPYPEFGVYPYWSGVWIWDTTGDALVTSGNGNGVLAGVQIRNCVGYGLKQAGYDLNVSDFYISACSLGGLYCHAENANNNYANGKVSFCGQTPSSHTAVDTGCNIYVGGTGDSFTNVRGQESLYDNWVVAGPMNIIRGCRSEDTGNIRVAHALGAVPAATRVRSALRLHGPAAKDNDIELFIQYAIPFSAPVNAATHGVYFSGGASQPTYNAARIRTIHTMRADADYYHGGTDPNGVAIPITTGVAAPALVGCDGTISALNDDFKVNGTQVA
jgi:hypothetical protein